jgi:hypothetical protein
MTTEFNELLSLLPDNKTQIWIVGNRDQVIHTMNELCVLRFVPDRAQFSPIVPALFAPGKFMTILER